MNATGKFLISALLVHAANLKKAGETQTALPIPLTLSPATGTNTPQSAAGK